MLKVKQYILRQVRFLLLRNKQLSNRQGIILLEIVLVAAMLSVLSAATVYYGQNWQTSTRKQSVRLASQIFIADLRQLQADAMFSGSKSSIVNVLSAKNGYYFTENVLTVKKVEFAKLGYGDVYFALDIKNLQFSNSGDPSVSGDNSYVLRHRKLDKFYCTVKIDAITGRMTIIEGT